MYAGKRALHGVLAVSLLTASLIGCGATRSAERSVVALKKPAADWMYVVDEMRKRDDIADRQVGYSSYWHLLPNVSTRRPGGSVAPISNRFVVGTVSNVSEGKAYRASGKGQQELRFADPSADWRTVHMTVAVEEEVGTKQALGKSATVHVGLAISGSSDALRIMSGLESTGRVALPLLRKSPVFSYNPRLLAIAEDGMLLATVDATGKLSLPFQSNSGRARSLLSESPTLADLKARGLAGPLTDDGA